jgi:hypothetical protein
MKIMYLAHLIKPFNFGVPLNMFNESILIITYVGLQSIQPIMATFQGFQANFPDLGRQGRTRFVEPKH